MTDKKLSDTGDQGAIDYAIDLKIENNRLKEELKQRVQPKYLFDGKSLKKAFNHWTWEWITIAIIMLSIVLTIYHVWPSTYETGRFYLDHTTYDYKRPKECNHNQQYSCNEHPGDLGNCYRIIKEVENGQDVVMSDCVREKNDAYKTANEFADEWKKLKSKAKSYE